MDFVILVRPKDKKFAFEMIEESGCKCVAGTEATTIKGFDAQAWLQILIDPNASGHDALMLLLGAVMTRVKVEINGVPVKLERLQDIRQLIARVIGGSKKSPAKVSRKSPPKGSQKKRAAKKPRTRV